MLRLLALLSALTIPTFALAEETSSDDHADDKVRVICRCFYKKRPWLKLGETEAMYLEPRRIVWVIKG